MGKHVQNEAEKEFGNKILTQQNEVALNLNHEQIARSISELENTAHLICNIQTVPKLQNTSVFSNESSSSDHQEIQESWIQSLSQDLQKFSNKLPSHQRLAVATGIAVFVRKHGNQLGSLVQPLIQSISTLFHHLQHQSETQMSLLQFIGFSSIFSRVSARTIETNKLLIFGQQSSRSTLSELIGRNETSQLMSLVQNSFLNQSSKFAQERILQRLINHADFSITQNKSKKAECRYYPENCLCSDRKVKIYFPRLPKQRQCLTKQNNYKFKWKNLTFLADGTNAISITRQKMKNSEDGGLLRILRSPVAQLGEGINGFLVSRHAVFFPDGLKENISIECLSSEMKRSSFQTSLPAHSVLRLTAGCNYSSSQIQIKFPVIWKTAKHSNINIDEIRRVSVLHFDHKLDRNIVNMMEVKFSEALLSEDCLHTKLNEIASQSWLQVFLFKWMEYILPYLIPAAATILIFIFVPLMLYLNCCCCCGNRSRKYLPSVLCAKSSQSDVESRLRKLETSFEFFIHDQFHAISEKDIRQKIEASKMTKEE